MIPRRIKVIIEVSKKELLEHFKTMRLLVISVIFVIVFFIIMGLGHYLIGGDVPVYKRGANEALGVLLAFSSLFPPILAIVLSYDLIVGERTRRSLHLILSKPVDRSSIFIGKFLAAFFSISFVYLIVCTVGYIIVIIFSGKTPSSIEVGRAYAAIFIILFSAACWILYVMFFSTSFKTITSTIIFSVLFWLFILNLISNSGILYYRMTRDISDDTVTVDILASGNQYNTNITSLVFWAHNFDIPMIDVEYNVLAENGSSIPRERGNSILSLFPTYILEPGNHTWTAKYKKDSDDSTKTVARGFLHVSNDFTPSVSIQSLDGDDYYNDLILIISIGDDLSKPGFDITVISQDKNEIISFEQDYFGPYFLKDLDNGDYRVIISRDNIVYFNTTVYSYGNQKREQYPYGISYIEEPEDYPDYVKITFVLNPDNAATVAYQVLYEDSTGGIIEVEQGLIALTVSFIVLFCLGLLVFSKIELL